MRRRSSSQQSTALYNERFSVSDQYVARPSSRRKSALYEALSNKLIAGAGIDVFEEESLDHDSPLLKLDNIGMTPHIASASIETRTAMAMMTVKNLVAVLDGKVPPNAVNPEVKNVRK